MATNILMISTLAILLIAPCWSHPVSEHPAENQISMQGKANTGYRLPEEFDALSYKIKLTPYFQTNDDKNFTFDGSVEMILYTKVASLKRIRLHANGLTTSANDITVERQDIAVSINVASISWDLDRDFLNIELGTELTLNKNYKIKIDYTGILRTETKGFYKSSYVQSGETKWLAATQFEPTHARKAFPCLDEPQYKARFTLTVVRPSSYSNTLSNMPIQSYSSSVTVTETFYETPLMSTYLLAIIVSNFKAAQITDNGVDEPFGVWARPEASDAGEYAFETGKRLLKAMGEYTKVDYYAMNVRMKMDNAAIPDFSAGAMENWGLITYREPSLMFSKSESSDYYRQKINSIMAHEIAHQWFGDLVTCHWWSSTWLNEGFATFFEHKLPDMVETLDMEQQFTILHLHKALLADTTILSEPLTYDNVNTPAEISKHFGTITYSKGGSVIRMMEHWIGEEVFQLGLSTYLNETAFQPATPSNLFEALQKEADKNGSLIDYPDYDVASVMSSWTTQSGYPVLQVEIDYETGSMTLTQSRMVTFGEELKAEYVYCVPITFASMNRPDFEDTKPVMIMNTTESVLIKEYKGREWVVFNKKQIGFYRVNYDLHSWEILASFLTGSERMNIHTLNRAQIVDDVLNLAKENLTNYANAFNVIQFLEKESDYAPWTAAYNALGSLRKSFSTAIPDSLRNLDKHILVLMKNVIETLGFEEKISGETHLTRIFRSSTLSFACLLGHEECIYKSKTMFETAMNGIRINPNYREHVYCNGLRHGNSAHFNFLWHKFFTENLLNEQLIILGALGCTNDSDSLNILLESTITDGSPIRFQDLMTAFNSALYGNSENVEVVFNFFKNNVTEIKHYYGANLQTALTNMIGVMQGTQLQRVYAFLTTTDVLEDSDIDSGIKAIAKAGINFEWANLHRNTIDSWLSNKYKNSAASIVSSFTLLLGMIVLLINN